MTKIKKYFLSLLILELLFSYTPAFAQTSSPTYNSGVDKQIEAYLCNPTAGGNGVLYQCINQLYKFAIVVAAVMGVFFIVIAGYVYMSADGNNESVDKAKSILESTLTALVILLGGYVFLNAINPDLVQFHGNTLQPVNISSTTGTTGGTSGGGQCTPVTVGDASVANLSSTCFGSNATMASSIANVESSGSNSSKSATDKCADGNSVSIGLFQINITAHPIAGLPCPTAFANGPYTASNKNCIVTNPSLYNQCVTAASNPQNNIQVACQISNNGNNWGAWGANSKCNFPN